MKTMYPPQVPVEQEVERMLEYQPAFGAKR